MKVCWLALGVHCSSTDCRHNQSNAKPFTMSGNNASLFLGPTVYTLFNTAVIVEEFGFDQGCLDVMSPNHLLHHQTGYKLRAVVKKKRSFYGQASCKGGGGQLPWP